MPSSAAASRPLTDLWLGLRVWRVRRLLAWALIAAACWQIVPTTPIPVPTQDGAASVLWPLVPVLYCMACAPSLQRLHGHMETLAPSATRLRAIAVAMTVTIGALVGLTAWRFDNAVTYRNTAALLGLALLSSALASLRTSWLPTVLTPMIMWLFGARPDHQGMHPWAFLLSPADSVLASVVAVALLVAGAAVYIAAPRTTLARAH